MSYEDKTLAVPPDTAEPELWDSARTVSPDPSWPAEKQLQWYRVASHVMLLNCSEMVRRKAARAADRETAGL